MIAKITTATPWGVDARGVQVEVDVYNGLPQMQIVGLPDASVRESRERVRSAIKYSGFDFPWRLFDRIDMPVEVPPVTLRELRGQPSEHPR